ncbi:MAG: serine hydrolase domain-containing protein [Chitinophagales bacterium]
MFKKIILIFLVCLLNSCTFSRIIMLNRPSIKDAKHFPTMVLPKAENISHPFVQKENQSLPAPQKWTRHQYFKGKKNLQTYLENTNTTSFIVVRNDTVLYENYFNDSQAQQQDIGFSIAKTFITSLLAIAIEEGYIEGLHQKIGDFLPTYAIGKRAKMTINDVLQMTSGLDYSEYTNNVWKMGVMYYNTNLEKLVNKAKLAYPPNTRFAYKSIDTQILGFCIEKAVGKTIGEYLNEKIWKPLGMECDMLFTLDRKNGNERMYGGLGMCSRDLMRFAKLYLDKGKWNDKQIIPEEWITNISKRHITKDKKNAKWWAYNKGWWLETYLDDNLTEQNDFYAAGYNGQCLYINPATNTIILRRGYNNGGVNWHIALGNLAELLDKGTQHQFVEEAKNKKRHIFEGKYRKKGGKKLAVLKRNVKNWLFETDDNTINTSLTRYCPQSLYNENELIRIIFQIENDKVVGLYIDNFQELSYFEKLD